MTDIIRPIGNGMFALVWATAIEAPRQADDTFRVQIPVRASLCTDDGTLIREGDGSEISVQSPIASVNYPASYYMHDPEFAAAYAAIDRVSKKILTGEIQPNIPPQPE